MESNEVNWDECLQALGFTEITNPLGAKGILDGNGIPTWQYDTEERQENLFYFFSGALYIKNHLMRC